MSRCRLCPLAVPHYLSRHTGTAGSSVEDANTCCIYQGHVSPALARTIVHASMLNLDPRLEGYSQLINRQVQTSTAILAISWWRYFKPTRFTCLHTYIYRLDDRVHINIMQSQVGLELGSIQHSSNMIVSSNVHHISAQMESYCASQDKACSRHLSFAWG